MRFLIALITLLAASSATAHAQTITALDRVQNLISAGRFTDARNTLTDWENRSGSTDSDVSNVDRARALYLRGILTDDATQAEELFISVVLRYPSTPSAPGALLRLGQALVTAGDHHRATGYLARLRNDYPGFDERDVGLLWLARAQLAAGAAGAACTTAGEAAATSNENVRTLASIERDRACAASPTRTANTAATTSQNNNTPARTQPAEIRAYAVQTAAFRDPKSAQTVAEQLRAKGFDVRVVTVQGSDLHRVRFGSFASAAEAAVASERIRDAGFAVMIVSDVARERKL